MLLPSKIICFDTETTDVDKHLGSIIQLSAILLDKNFEIVKGEEFNEYIKPIDNHRNAEAMNINKISEETLANAMSLNEVLELFENFCGKGITLASWPSYFDIPFLKCQYEKISRKWIFGHRCIDLKTLAIWESAKRNNPVKGGIMKYLISQNKKFEGTQHDALSDIKNAVSIIKNYEKNISENCFSEFLIHQLRDEFNNKNIEGSIPRYFLEEYGWTNKDALEERKTTSEHRRKNKACKKLEKLIKKWGIVISEIKTSLDLLYEINKTKKARDVFYQKTSEKEKNKILKRIEKGMILFGKYSHCF